MRIVAYLRVSTNEQADSGAGLAAQRATIIGDIERRGWSIDDVDFLVDAGFSGKSLKRPAMEEALERLRAGDASILMVSKMDRLSRSMLDFAGLLQRATREGWKLVALDSPADLTTAPGEAMASVMMVFSQLERRLIGERTKAALAQKKAEGVILGRRREIPADVERRILDEHAKGRPYGAIARALNDEGVPTARGGRWHPATISRVVTSRTERPTVTT